MPDMRIQMPDRVRRMKRWRTPRLLAASLLAASFLLLVASPLCSAHACPMGTAVRPGCPSFGMECCKARAQGVLQMGAVLLANASPGSLLPASEVAIATTPTVLGPRTHGPLPSVVLRGVGLHTLHGVFRN